MMSAQAERRVCQYMDLKIIMSAQTKIFWEHIETVNDAYPYKD